MNAASSGSRRPVDSQFRLCRPTTPPAISPRLLQRVQCAIALERASRYEAAAAEEVGGVANSHDETVKDGRKVANADRGPLSQRRQSRRKPLFAVAAVLSARF